MTFGSFKVISFIVIISNRDFNFSVPKERSFPFSLKYIDDMRSTHTVLDVAQRKRIDDYWNVDGNRSLSDLWTGFGEIYDMKRDSFKGYMWSREN